MPAPAAYFITFTTYGQWLHGDPRGSVEICRDRPGESLVAANPQLHQRRRQAMNWTPYRLDPARRTTVLRTVIEVAGTRKWFLRAAHVRTAHVHVVLSAGDSDPEKVMADLKAWCSRRLRERFAEPPGRKRWTEHGSTRWLHHESEVENTAAYALDEQGERMAWYDSSSGFPTSSR